MKKYFSYSIKKAITVKKLITIESLEVSDDFSYPSETHDFYEFVYVDSGKINCNLHGEVIELNQSELLIIAPEKEHFYTAVKNSPANIFIVCFACNSSLLDVFQEKILLDKQMKNLLSDIVKEAKNVFSFPFNKKLKVLPSPLFGAGQLVENKVEELLILAVRNEINQNSEIKLVLSSVELENNLVTDIISLLKNNIYNRISLQDVSDQLFFSKTYLNNLFKKYVNYSIMHYYCKLKIEESKLLLKKGLSITEIASALQFESATYFTKFFKKHVNQTPSSYKKSIL